jgi:predicted chitinase
VLEMWYHQGTRFYRVLKEVQAGSAKQYVPLLTGDKAFEMKGYEYDLYARALRMYPDCPSAGTDLMRYGRIVGVDPAPANQADCWLAMPFGTGADQMGYVDLAKAAVLKFSDADFPHFKGWTRVKESGVHATDGKVDVQFLTALLATADANKDGTTTADEFARYLKSNADVRRRLRYLMCQAPSEWDDTYNASRYDGLLQPGKAFHNKPADFEQFKTFIKKFQFWGQARSALTAHGVSSSSLWYFHPLQFIKQFRKANWLTLDEMTQLTPLGHMSHEKEGKPVEVSTNYFFMRSRLLKGIEKGGEDWGYVVPENVWLNINWMCIRYGLDTLGRKAHFWAQMTQETGQLTGVSERGDKAYFLRNGYDTKNENLNADDAVQFRGRGLIQITGREKYSGYSTYRMPLDFTTAPNHERIAKSAFEACDSSGWYYSYFRPRTCAAADAGNSPSDVTAVTKAVNGGTNHLANRQTFFIHALYALGDQVGLLPKEYSPLNPDAWAESERQKQEADARKKIVNLHGDKKTAGAPK